MQTNTRQRTGERRLVSLWFPRLATDRLAWLRRTRPEAGKQAGRKAAASPAEPRATVCGVRGGFRIAAVDASAEATGIVPGMPLADARAMVPDLAVSEAEPLEDRRALDRLAEWCGRYTPWTAADDGGHGVRLDISGCAHLFDGEQALLDDLGCRLAVFGFEHRLAAAPTRGAAWALARFADGGDSRIRRLLPHELEPVLSPLPVAALRLVPATVEGLHRLGLRRIGDLTAAPRGPLAARFGSVLLERLDQALGRAGEPFGPRHPAPPFRFRRAFAEPLGRNEDVAAALDGLLRAAAERLGRERLGARRLGLACYRTDGTVWDTHVGTSRPSRDGAHLARLFAENLTGLDVGFGIETVILAVLAADPLAPEQECLSDGRGTAKRDRDAVARLIDRLGGRFGADAVLRLEAHPSHVPERAARAVSALSASASPAAGERPALSGAGRPQAARPVRLLPWPQPIEVVAPVPDHPPLLFQWRRRRHRVVRAEGPERIGPEWWREDPELLALGAERVRDYYCVEDERGGRYWVFRAGLYRPDTAPRWYLHGVFG